MQQPTAEDVLFDEDVITFGRDQTCEVVLGQQAVSRTTLESREMAPSSSSGSRLSFGTQVNGEKLPQGEKRLLRNGDVIAIAQFDVIFDRVTEEASRTPPDELPLSQGRQERDEGLSSGQNAYFRVMNGSAEGQHRGG